jgi:hypothetical protein
MSRLQHCSRYLSLLLPLILILSIWFLLSEGTLYQSAYYGKLYTHLLWLTIGSEVRQEFVANYPGLNQVDIFVKSLNPAVPTEITFQLRQTCQSQSNLRKQVAVQPQDEIEGQIFYTFTFEPLEESTNQKYCFILTRNTEGDEKTIGVMNGERNVYPAGQAFYQEPLFEKTSNKPEVIPALQLYSEGKIRIFLPIIQAHPPSNENLDVAFQLHYHGSRFETGRIFFDRLITHKSYVWGNPEFYGLIFIAYIVSVVALLQLL